MANMPELEVYCNTCLRNIRFSSLEPFVCANTGVMVCPMPYHFEVFRNKKDAEDRYDSVDSWMPKFYFQPRDVATGKKHGAYWCIAYNSDPVAPLYVEKISDIFWQSTLLLLESGLSNEIHGPIAIIEPGGKRVEKVETIPGLGYRLYIPQNCTDYCRRIRTSEFKGVSGNQVCMEFDESVLERMRVGEAPQNLLTKKSFDFGDTVVDVYVYICWAGLVDYAAPIRVEDKLIAVVFAGQHQLLVEDGKRALSEGIAKVENKLSIPSEELRLAAEKDANSDKTIDLGESMSKYLERLAKIVHEFGYLAKETYIRKRQDREDYFLREIKHIIVSGNGGAIHNNIGINRALNRLREFFGLQEAYFLFCNVRHPNIYEIFGKGSSPVLNSAEEDFSVRLDVEELGVEDKVSVFEVLHQPRYSKIAGEVQTKLSHIKMENVWLGSCPLPGINNGIWLFINALSRSGLRSGTEITPLDKHFLAKFCLTVHDIIEREFASSIVMRSIGHEFAAGIQSIISKEERIQVDSENDELRECAERNIAQMEKYYYLVGNLRSLFIKKGSDAYIFKKRSVRGVVMNTYESCLYDDEVERRNIYLREPRLFGKAVIEMDIAAMRLAVYNLLQNAIKYSFDNHHVDVYGEKVETMVGEHFYRLQISNFGVGITEGEITRSLIFKADYRGILSRDRNRPGSGLGLAIVDRIIRNHKGNIYVTSISAVELANRKKHRQPLPKGAIERLINPDKDLEFGFLTTFIIDLPFTQKENKKDG